MYACVARCKIFTTSERNIFSEHTILCVRQSRLNGGIMFSTCRFVHLSVHPFVRYQIVNAIILKTNELISTQIGTNLPSGQGHEQSTSGVKKSKVKVTGGRSYVWNHGGDITLHRLVE